MLRTIPDSFDPTVVAAIDARLDALQRSEHVTIPLAIESGSRAWGFPSPDSDYDTRFVFVRRIEDYLSPWPRRDVIETPIEGLLDVNGWDLRKPLQLLLKGNAVILEWLQSPIHYGVDPWFQTAFLELGREVADRNLALRHYFHTAERQRALHLGNAAQVPAKKLFYVLRPMLALRWLRLRPDSAVAPMHFQTLVEETGLSQALKQQLFDLVQEKAYAGEQAVRPLDPAIAAFIDAEMAVASAALEPSTVERLPRHKAMASEFMRAAVARYGN